MKKIIILSLFACFVYAGATLSVGSIEADGSGGYNIRIDYKSDAEFAGFQFDLLSGGALTVDANVATSYVDPQYTTDVDCFMQQGSWANNECTLTCASSVLSSVSSTNNVILAFDINAATIPASSTYTPLLVLNATVNNGFESATVTLDAKEDCVVSGGSAQCASRLVVSDSNGLSIVDNTPEGDWGFTDAVWTIGGSWTLDNEAFSPVDFSLSDNYPNPFNPTTTIEYSIAEPSFVNLSIFDASGRLVKTLVSSNEGISGSKSVVWDATNNFGAPVAAGMYLYKIEAGNFVETKKMLLVK